MAPNSRFTRDQNGRLEEKPPQTDLLGFTADTTIHITHGRIFLRRGEMECEIAYRTLFENGPITFGLLKNFLMPTAWHLNNQVPQPAFHRGPAKA